MQFVQALSLRRQFYFDFQGHQENESVSAMLVFSSLVMRLLSMYQVKLTGMWAIFGTENSLVGVEHVRDSLKVNLSFCYVENNVRNIGFHKYYLLLALYLHLMYATFVTTMRPTDHRSEGLSWKKPSSWTVVKTKIWFMNMNFNP